MANSPSARGGSGGSWEPAGLITLLTDFGLSDPYVGVMKGVLHAALPAVRTVDLTHGVPAQDVARAAFFLAHAWRWFPRGTVHVAVVDPGVGTERRILVAEEEGHAFLAPDNGLLAPVLSDAALVRELDVARFARAGASRTFHGRDVFAPAAAAIAGGLGPADAGRPASGWRRLELPRPARRPDGSCAGEVLFADAYGNLVTNLEAPAALDGWAVAAGDRRARLVGAYGEAAAGELCALVDSYGLLEVAVRDGSAERELGLASGDPVVLVRWRS